MRPGSKGPAYGTLASLCHFPERLMDMDSLIFTYPQGSTVNEADACSFAQKYLLDERGQWDGHFFFQFNKMVMGKRPWGIAGAYAGSPFPYGNASDNGIPSHGKVSL